MLHRRTILSLCVVSLAAGLVSVRRADAVTGVSGDLVSGGIAKGDISRDPADMDTITVALEAGETIGLRWNGMFTADVHFTDPSAVDVAFTTASQRMGRIDRYLVPTTGVYTFSIASADGSQGTYSLRVLPKWARSVSLEGTGQMTFDVPMPANSMLRGTVRAPRGSSQPSIVSLTSPTGAELLADPVAGKGALVRLPATNCPEAGVYHLTVAAAGGSTAFTASVRRSAAPLVPTKIDLRNGIDVISFANDGIDTYFQQRCVSCHDWARSYAGVRAFARDALGRMRTGNMPKDGPRADAAFLGLFSQWITGGYAK